MQKFRSIQALRGVAALGVVVYHATGTRFGVGAAGVDLFFVISGFIMAHVAVGKSSADFMADRLWRILPLWFIAVAARLLTYPADWSQCRTLATVTMWPAWPDWCFPYVVQGWTLSYELFFYALVAIFIRRLSWLFAIVPLFVLWRLALPTPPFLWLGNPLILEFLVGMALAKAPRKYGGIALTVGLVYFAVAPESTKSLMRVIYWGVPAALVFHGALCFEDRFNGLGSRALVAIGDASYSLYLFHIILMRPLLGSNAALVVVVAVLGGIVIHRYVERPLLKNRPRILPIRNPALEAGTVRVDHN